MLTERELVEIAEGLLAGWEQAPDRRTGQRGKHPESTLVVFGLAAHVHRLGRAVLVLRREGMVLEAMPLVRSAFEAALTCAWVNEVPDALRRWATRTSAGGRRW